MRQASELDEGAERGRELVEALVLFQPSHTQQHDIVAPDAGREADAGALGRRAKTIDRVEIERVRDHAHPCRRDAQVLQHDRLERTIRRDDAIRRARAREDRAPKWQIARALERRLVRARRAEFLEPLRVEHERRGASRAPPRVAEHARAEPVDYVDLPIANEIGGDPACAEPEQRICGAPIEHGRAASAGQRERSIRDRDQSDPWIEAGPARRRGAARRSSNERHVHVSARQILNEIVDVTLESADAVERKGRAGDDGDADHPLPSIRDR